MRQVRPTTVVMVTALVALTLLGFYALYLLHEVLILCFIAILVATAVEPLVERLRRGPFSRGQGVIIVYVGIFGTLIGLGALIVPPIAAEVSRVVESLPRTAADLRASLATVDNRLIQQGAGTVLGKVEQAPAEAQAAATAPETAERVVEAGRSLVEIIVEVMTVFIIGIYWLLERTRVKRGLLRLFRLEHRARANEIWATIETKLGGWVRGQLVLMLAIGLMSGLGYGAMGVKYAVVLAVWAAVAELIPMVGPILGTAPAVLVALTQSVQLAAIVLVYGIIIQVIENNILVPRIMGHAVGISPLTVLLGILAGSTLGGITGALLAVPLAGALQVIYQELFPSSADTAAPTALAETEAPAPVTPEPRLVEAGSRRHV